MKLYFVRHGETDSNRDGIMQGQSINQQLNDRGVRTCLSLKNKLSSTSFDTCYTSPMLRAWSTALIIAGEKCIVQEDSRLIERYLGDFEGKERAEYDMSKFWDYELDSTDNVVESIRSLISRCRSFLEYILDKYDDSSNVLIVSHAGIIRCFHYLLSGSISNKDLLTLSIENASVREYNISKKDFK